LRRLVREDVVAFIKQLKQSRDPLPATVPPLPAILEMPVGGGDDPVIEWACKFSSDWHYYFNMLDHEIRLQVEPFLQVERQGNMIPLLQALPFHLCQNIYYQKEAIGRVTVSVLSRVMQWAESPVLIKVLQFVGLTCKVTLQDVMVECTNSTTSVALPNKGVNFEVVQRSVELIHARRDLTARLGTLTGTNPDSKHGMAELDKRYELPRSNKFAPTRTALRDHLRSWFTKSLSDAYRAAKKGGGGGGRSETKISGEEAGVEVEEKDEYEEDAEEEESDGNFLKAITKERLVLNDELSHSAKSVNVWGMSPFLDRFDALIKKHERGDSGGAAAEEVRGDGLNELDAEERKQLFRELKLKGFSKHAKKDILVYFDAQCELYKLTPTKVSAAVPRAKAAVARKKKDKKKRKRKTAGANANNKK
jgi:hypothetical protein